MKITVLMDNNTYIDAYYLGEPAVSYYIEDGGARILLDCGYSDAFLQNAQAMGINLSKLTHVVFSHGHDDHTRGLKFLREKFDLSAVEIIAHPDVFYPREDDQVSFGAPYLADEVASFSKLTLSKSPLAITERLTYLGQIDETFDFEARYALGRRGIKVDGAASDDCMANAGSDAEAGCSATDALTWVDDFCLDDTALVYRGEDGLFIITGCSHSGICNIVEHAKRLTGEERIAGILGGFHLFDVDERLTATIDYLQSCNIRDFYPCHCVSLKAKAKMMEKLDVEEVGVGLKIEVK